MANSNIPPLLSPPPIWSGSDPNIMHTWLNNAYIYLFQTTQNLNNSTASITEMEQDIVALETNQATDEAHIATNTSDISSLKSSRTTDEANIATNTTNIATNTTNISTLQTTTGLVKLSSATYSAQVSVSLPTVFSGYTAYKIILEDVFSSSGSAQIVVNFSTNGSTYDATAAHYACQILTSATTTVTGSSGINTGIGLLGTGNVGTTIITGLSGEYMVTNPSTTTGYVRLVGNGVVSTSSSALLTEQIVGQYNQTGTTVKGFKLTSSTGNISGTVKVYGLL